MDVVGFRLYKDIAYNMQEVKRPSFGHCHIDSHNTTHIKHLGSNWSQIVFNLRNLLLRYCMESSSYENFCESRCHIVFKYHPKYKEQGSKTPCHNSTV